MVRKLFKRAVWASQTWRLYRHMNRSRIPVVMYHGVTDDPDCLDWTQMQVSNFESQIRYLTSTYRVVSISELNKMFDCRRLDARAAIITFDDGYESFKSEIVPILRKYNAPATIFICSKFICEGHRHRHDHYLWPDYISALLLSSNRDLIDLQQFGLGRYDLSTREAFDESRNRLINRLKLIDLAFIDRVQAHLKEFCGGGIDHDRFSLYHPMTWDELREVSADPLVTIGAHTRKHPILSALSEEELFDEVVGSKNDLEMHLNKPVLDFAYPNGRLIDISPESVTLVKKYFRSAFSSVWGLNTAAQDRHLIRRIGIAGSTRLPDFELLLSGILNLGGPPADYQEVVRTQKESAEIAAKLW